VGVVDTETTVTTEKGGRIQIDSAALFCGHCGLCVYNNLRRGSFLLGIDADLEAGAVLVLELHEPVDQRVDREVCAKPDVAAGVPFGAALPNDDVAGDDLLATELLHAPVLRIAVASVSR